MTYVSGCFRSEDPKNKVDEVVIGEQNLVSHILIIMNVENNILYKIDNHKIIENYFKFSSEMKILLNA